MVYHRSRTGVNAARPGGEVIWDLEFGIWDWVRRGARGAHLGFGISDWVERGMGGRGSGSGQFRVRLGALLGRLRHLPFDPSTELRDYVRALRPSDELTDYVFAQGLRLTDCVVICATWAP